MGAVVVKIGGREVTLASGEELVVSKLPVSAEAMFKADGIGRRSITKLENIGGGLHAATCEISILSVLSSTEHLNALRHPNSSLERNLHDRLMKTAAAVQTITQGHGAYRANRKQSTPAEPQRFARTGLEPVGYTR
jgi:hypothetical protein